MKLAQAVHDYIALKQSLGFRFHTEATIRRPSATRLAKSLSLTWDRIR
jgi:hypothetical protein